MSSSSRSSQAQPQDDQAEPEAFRIIPGAVDSGLLLICDHAENTIPDEYAALGLPPAALRRHIAWDPGAAAVTRHLAAHLGVPAVLSRFSRLLIDPNRGTDDPTLIMRLSDGAVVPGNATVDGAERALRIRRFYAPYHEAIAAAVAAGIASGVPPAIVSIHSFTPVWRGALRPWHIGILWDQDPRFPVPMIAALRADPALIVGDNEPYSGALANDTLFRHATEVGLANLLIELRQDLVGDEAGAEAWAARLAEIIASLNRDPALHTIRVHGSRAALAPNSPASGNRG